MRRKAARDKSPLSHGERCQLIQIQDDNVGAAENDSDSALARRGHRPANLGFGRPDSLPSSPYI